MKSWFRWLAALGLCAVAGAGVEIGLQDGTPGLTLRVANGVRYTTGGQRIDAHSGTVLRAQDGLFYWYGETYACGFRWTDPTSPYCGAQVYQSQDLHTWRGPWPLFDASTRLWQDICMHEIGAPGGGCFRPKVVFNASTGLYVLWLNTPGFGGDGYMVLTSAWPTGPFALVGAPDLDDDGIPDWRGNSRAQDGDEGLFVDPAGTGWVVWSRGGRLLEERLNAAFTSGDGRPVTIMNYPQLAPWSGVEAPSEFEHNGRYYLAMSLPRCPYCTGTGTGIEQAPSPGGPWTYQGMVSPTSCGGQPDEVDQLGPGLLLWTSDQWIQGGAAGIWPRLNETLATQAWNRISFTGGNVDPIACSRSFRVTLGR